MKPKLFIGSAVEALSVAYAIQHNLDYDAETTVWTQGIFDLSQSATESLVELLNHMDFGVFVFTPDDVLNIRGEENKATRDNVVFELGLFVGRLGRDRSFIFMPRNQEDFRLPTDLIGMTPATYDSERSDNNFRAATGPACDEVREAISRLGSRLKGNETVNAAQEIGESIERRSSEGEESTRPNEPKPELSEEAVGIEAKASDEWLNEMITAFLNDEAQRVEEAYEQALKAESDATEKLRIEAIYLRLRYMRGDVTALEKLQDLLEQGKELPVVLSMVHNFIGLAYEQGDDFLKANEAYEAAAEAVQTEEECAECVASAARCLFAAGSRQEAFHRVTSEIDRVSNHEALSILYRGLASLYKRIDISDLRAIALQKAIEYKPNDTQLRFHAAYSFKESDFSAIALMNYKTLLRFKSDEASTLNNIGVIYGQLEMPIKQISSYKRAFENSNTLSAANLAYDYMNAGFADEATEILNKAMEKEEVHPNVGSALAALAHKKEAESEIEQEALEAAHEQRHFLTSFAQAYFSKPSVNPQYEGSWHFSDGVEATVTRKNGELEIKWERNDKEHVMSARTQNRGALITKYSRRDSSFPSSLGDKGYAHLSQDNQQMSIMVLKGNRHFFLTLKRNQ